VDSESSESEGEPSELAEDDSQLGSASESGSDERGRRKDARNRVRNNLNHQINTGGLLKKRMGRYNPEAVDVVVNAFSALNNVAYDDVWAMFDGYSETW
jgi:hypothetical protein